MPGENYARTEDAEGLSREGAWSKTEWNCPLSFVKHTGIHYDNLRLFAVLTEPGENEAGIKYGRMVKTNEPSHNCLNTHA